MFLLFLVLSLFAPIGLLLFRNGPIIDLNDAFTSTLGLALLLYYLVITTRHRSAKAAATIGGILIFLMMLIRALLNFIYDFSGQGFSGDFFTHLNPTAFSVAWGEYHHLIIGILSLIFLATFLTVKLMSRLRPLKRLPGLGILSAALILSYTGAKGSPEFLLINAYARYSQTATDSPETAESKSRIRQQALQLLKPIRMGLPLPIEKSAIRTESPRSPNNLILIYLESFNAMLTRHPSYPNLTPNINKLKQKYQNFSQIYSSAFVTIEGIANSQCGTLFNMDYANNSLTNRKGRLYNLPCLGDILDNAGYQQTYLGGADLAFAGKGEFLKDHGYGAIRGFEYWSQQGFSRYENWGLADNELFDQALLTIEQYRTQATPFNLTLLTLGTHIPGYVYETCPTFSEDKKDRYLNAIHCTDFLLGKFVDKLEKTGVLQDTLLFIQADHGVFQNIEMKKLFGNQIYDSRLLTIMATPHVKAPKIETNQNIKDDDKEGSSVNTVATILNNLNISHNVDFILGNAHTQQVAQPYFVSRRNDHINRKAIASNMNHCDEPNIESASISLPLDNCEKHRVMRSLNQLNLSYAFAEKTDNQLCELGVTVNRDRQSNRLTLSWGNQNLSDNFYWRGINKRADQILGIYAVLLDKQDQVQQTQFYAAHEPFDLQSLRDLLKNSINSSKVFLATNADINSLPSELIDAWPPILREQQMAYANLKPRGLALIKKNSSIKFGSSFIPESCQHFGTQNTQ